MSKFEKLTSENRDFVLKLIFTIFMYVFLKGRLRSGSEGSRGGGRPGWNGSTRP